VSTGRRDDQELRRGLYGPDSEAWRLNREGVLLLGSGPRAILLQLAHPLIAEGVDQHSDFRTDPWTRLRATVRSYMTIVFAPADVARGEIRRLNRLHRSITGPVRDPGARRRFGDAYSGRDPGLSLWVHATLVESIMTAYDAWIEPLSRDRRAAYYEETVPIGRGFGISPDAVPADLDAFDAYWARMTGADGPVHVSPIARDLARYVLHPRLDALVPLLGWVPPVTYDWLMWPAVGLLPAGLRDEFGIPWNPWRAAVAAWLKIGMENGRLLFPPAARWFPIANRAYARVGVRG
jgi:uncharacterized protein (DUF2236 family)